jgi:hypothetical protein
MRTSPEKRFLPEAGPASRVTDFAETFPKIPALVGHGTRCGKPTCRCTRGQLHPTHYLRWRDGSVQRRRYVRTADVPVVRAILAKRRQQRATERLALALSMRSWRELSGWIAEYEASLEGERTER